MLSRGVRAAGAAKTAAQDIAQAAAQEEREQEDNTNFVAVPGVNMYSMPVWLQWTTSKLYDQRTSLACS